MVQLITDKKRRVFTNFEWMLMKLLFIAAGVALGIGVSYFIMNNGKEKEKEKCYTETSR